MSLAWDPVFGAWPVESAGEEWQASPPEYAGQMLLAAPAVDRETGVSRLAHAPGQVATQHFGPLLNGMGRARFSVSFTSPCAMSQAIFEDLIEGAGEFPQQAVWLLDCYQAMRAAGHWPVVLPLEQMLAERGVFERHGLLQPACPAALQ